MWSIKNDTNVINHKTEIDSQIQKTNLCFTKWKGEERINYQIYTTIYKVGKKPSPTIQHRELYSMSYNNL